MSLDPLQPPIISEEDEWKESDDFLNTLRNSVQTTGTNINHQSVLFTPIRKSLFSSFERIRWRNVGRRNGSKRPKKKQGEIKTRCIQAPRRAWPDGRKIPSP